MPQPKQIRLAINLLASGRHNAAWKTLDDPAGLSTDIDVFLQIARTAERGLLDGIFLADNYAGLNEESLKRPFRALDPSVLLAALATHTRHIGPVSTVPALYANPATDDGGGRDREPGPAGRRGAGAEPDAQLLPRNGGPGSGRAGHRGGDRGRLREGVRRHRDDQRRCGPA